VKEALVEEGAAD